MAPPLDDAYVGWMIDWLGSRQPIVLILIATLFLGLLAAVCEQLAG